MIYSELFETMDSMLSKDKYTVPQFPPSEVLKHKDGTIEIFMAVAGYNKENIEIETSENKIIVKTIEGYKQPTLPEEATRISPSNIKRAAFKNAFFIPETKFNLNEISAKIENGVLGIKVPPKEKKEYKQVTIE